MPDATTIDPRLLAILVCPVTKGPLTYDRAAQERIPIMLPEEARLLDDE